MFGTVYDSLAVYTVIKAFSDLEIVIVIASKSST